MIHYTRRQLEWTMHAYCFHGPTVHYSSVELYGVPFIVSDQDRLWNLSLEERQEIAGNIIEDLRAVDFMVPDPLYRRVYQITKLGQRMIGNRYLFTADILTILWRKLVGRIMRWWAWRGVMVSE